jgi:uncharacterized protein with HEPN domain
MAKLVRPVEFWLEQIVDLATRLSGHVAGMTATQFVGDQKTIDAASWCIGCIGEASGKILQIDPLFDREHGELNLLSAYSARNRYVHGYYDLDVEQVWQTAVISVPAMSAAARKILDGAAKS